MPRCSKCGRFQEEDGLCAECREALETAEALNPATEGSAENEQDTLLLTVADENEANIVQSLLQLNNIPSLRKHRGAGGYLQIYMGTSNLGIDIFVLEKHLKEAEAILEGYADGDTEDGTENKSTENAGKTPDSKEDDSDDLDQEVPTSVKRLNSLVVILAVFFVLNLIIILLMSNIRR